MIYKNFLLAIFLIVVISCNDNCKNMDNIDFAKDIEIMAESKKVCNTNISSVKWGLNLILEYDDNNFSLFQFNEKIKILSDKKRNINLCIKTNEVANFSVIYNSSDKFVYGIDEIYFLDETLMPLYSISKDGSYKYENDLNNKQIKYYLIDEEKISFLNLDYKKALDLYEKLKKIKIKNPKVEISPNYKNPYSWEIP